MAVHEDQSSSFWITCDNCGCEARGAVRSRDEADALKIVAAEGWWSDDYEARDLCNKCCPTSDAPTPKPLPTAPAWYPNIVIESYGEKAVGAMLAYDGWWCLPERLDNRGSAFHPRNTGVTIRWATPSEVTE